MNHGPGTVDWCGLFVARGVLGYAERETEASVVDTQEAWYVFVLAVSHSESLCGAGQAWKIQWQLFLLRAQL